MARYIDADALIEDIKRVYCTDCNNYNEVRCRACGTDDAMTMIEDAPTADVAPRSELAILSVQNAALEKAKFELQQELEACKGLKKILDTCAAELKKKYIGE